MKPIFRVKLDRVLAKEEPEVRLYAQKKVKEIMQITNKPEVAIDTVATIILEARSEREIKLTKTRG